MSSTTKPQKAQALVVNGEIIDLKSLPVAPEFVDVLAENATKTALDHLKKIQAEPDLISLVESISSLGYYLKLCFSDPGVLLGERKHRFDIETVVIEAVNAIANLDGEFHGPYGAIPSREEAQQMKDARTKKTTKGK